MKARFGRLLVAWAVLGAAGCQRSDDGKGMGGAPAVACDGVSLTADGDAYCAHHDVAAFACPPDLPVRRAFRGVALCSHAAIDDALAERVARAALHTGGVLEAREITGFAVPEAWQRAPGAPAGEPLDIQVDTQTASDISWSTADGDPELCARTFDRFEVEPDGFTLRVTAWDRLHCGPEVLGHGLVENETLPLTLPARPAGRHTLVGAFMGTEVARAPLVVDLGAACPARPPLAECFRGAMFADCDDGGPAALWCGEFSDPPYEWSDCLWFGGCPAAGYDRPVDCHGDSYCPEPGTGWGAEPWTRERDRVVEVAVGDVSAGDPTVACECGGARLCLPSFAGLCNPERAEGYEAVRDPGSGDRNGWSLPGMVSVWLYAVGPALGLGDDWAVLLEIDFFAEAGPSARICLVSTSDAGAPGPPTCARSGRLTVNRRVQTAADVADLHGAFDAELADVPLAWQADAPRLPTLRLRGRF